jgi:HAMP domain-containing protein/CheY-like chemotaxis protein/signal transduction histidine kinase
LDTLPPSELLRVLRAFRKGNFGERVALDYSGIAGEVAEALNDAIEMADAMESELSRIKTVVGKEGKLSQRAALKDARGAWVSCIDSVNELIADLVQPTNEVGRVIGAVASGDLSQTMTMEIDGRPLRGEFLRTAKVVNGMVEQLGSFASEVTRVAREVGTEGKLGGQAKVRGVSGTWKDLTDSVNLMAGNLTAQVRNIADVTTAVAQGDLSKKITVDVKGEILQLKETINTMVDQLNAFASEVTRVAREVGTEGKLGGQAEVPGVGGTWKDLTDNVNSMASNLTAQVRNIAEVTTAVAQGDLTKKITVDVKGEILQLKQTINTMVDQLNAFASEVTRVAREVGTEGKLGGQAEVQGVAGTWKDLTDSVNSMASNLTAQVRNIAEVATAVASGDLTKRITVDVKGEILELKNTINTMADQLNAFASEVTRVAREVGTEGKLGGQAEVSGVAGTWKDLTDSVNSMASNLTSQVRNIAEVTTAVARGDLTKKITVDVKGEILQLKSTINTMVDQLNSFASEVTRVAREVGTDGKLGGQAQVPGVAGTWKDLTDNVNSMASNLTSQVRNIADVTTAVAKGDLTKKITVDVKGEILQLKNTINTMVDQLNAFASEVTRVAREVGTEGKLGGQAQVEGVAGTWKDLTDSVNSMASNLTAQVRNIAEVTTAVANGDLSKKITVDVKGEILELKNTINTMVDQLSSFASEVTRVAREVGTDGKLGGQAQVKGVAGTWKDLTDSVNSMASNLTSQVRNIADVTTAVAKGDLSKKITVDVRGEILELKNTINTMVDQLRAFAAEVTRVAREVGTDGKLGGQAQVEGVAGTWKDLTDSVNQMAANLTGQVRNIAEVTTAVATGDLSKKITVDVRGEILELKNTINTMVDQLNAFASEVTRVAREVGTEGKLGGQAQVRGVAGTWKDLTDNVNSMASNLTSQVRGIAKVVTAVANGDLAKKLALEARGEIAELAETINSMTDTLAIFAEQVTSVAREVGVEGKLGGQAKVPGAAGTWRDLTDNVNQLAGNLTTQVRAIGDVATAVTKGDLTRSITVDASGEVAALKDNINEMIRNLRETTQKTTEQDWLKTNLAKFTRMLQGQRDLVTVARQILSELAPLVDAQHGVFYIADKEDDVTLKLLASYAFTDGKQQFKLGEGLVGQCAFEKKKINLSNVPPDYVRVSSGLGDAPPRSIIVLPVLFEGQVNAVIELASFERLSEIHQVFLDQLTESIGIVVNTIAAGMRTETLLKQSQSLTQELQSQQEELRETNERLEKQAATLRESEERLRQQQEELQLTNEKLEDKAKLLEIKNREVEFAKSELEEKAEQLALTSKYKSEFLANMSHELRTPLNSLLILSKMLSDNADGNLSGKQVEFARTIHGSGADLLSLINDILDLSKIESGTITVEPSEVGFTDLRDYVEQNFRHIAAQKGLGFEIELDPRLPRSVNTDAKRLQQVLKNLLSNAFKFTEHGKVKLSYGVATEGWSRDNQSLASAQTVLAFSVTDTGIGIPGEKQKIIFEAFQQADGTTSRKYGGTGLGLSISREIARLLGGEIKVVSTPGQGSSFTMYVPRQHRPVQPVPQPARSRIEVLDLSNLEAAAAGGVAVAREPLPMINISDDRDTIQPGDRSIIIIEDDAAFAQILLECARENGWKGVVSSFGDTGVGLVRKLQPSAITLDLRLPDIDGWTVLDRLKHDVQTRHIPVEIISAAEDRHRARKMGAFGVLEKPASREDIVHSLKTLAHFVEHPVKKLLIVEDDARERETLVQLVGETGVETVAVGTGEEALAALEAHQFRCMVLDLGLPDMSGLELLQRIKKTAAWHDLPIVVYTGRELSRREEMQLKRLSETIILKDVKSPERLLDETALYLHRSENELTAPQRAMISQLHQGVPELAGRKILVVDDDIRNIFAITAALERYNVTVQYAENGKDGLELLKKTPDVDVVLMDIMMPELDGYEVMRLIRQEEAWKQLPIIALTAKAMRSDRDKCIQAGASDYISKPVELDKLLSMLRVWLSN